MGIYHLSAFAKKQTKKPKKNNHTHHPSISPPQKIYCNDSKITEFEIIATNDSSTTYVAIYKLVT